jgi:ferredoxin
MRIELRYFTGTGNSLKVLDTCREKFQSENHEVRMSSIDRGELRIPGSDILGFCFPVYAFGIPRICRRYLKSIESFKNPQKTFVIITAGDHDESGFSIKECERLLRRKNCTLVYTAVVQMPINWITSPEPPFTPSREEATVIIKNGIDKAGKIACDILEGKRLFHKFNYPVRYTVSRFYRDYWLFRYLGIANLWRTFRVYDSCNGCRLCEKVCPTHSISFTGSKPIWASSCEQCMRCANFCPHEAIFQSMGGDTKGKNRYLEPGFKPLLR